ncbi:hypothetical protein BDZ89DRAFT_955396, partial [Hymenopellis radicata]
DWTACIELDKFELGCSFSVIFFLGEVPTDPEDWLCCDTLVGTHNVLVYPGPAANSRKFLMKGGVRLDYAIAQRSGLSSLEPSVVEPYLAQALQWRVRKTDGTPAELKSLEVYVLCTPLSYPPGDIFPVAGETCRYNSITYGRPGGSRHA